MRVTPAIEDPYQSLHQALAEFRHQLRVFLLASEEAAHRAGLHPQQHQLLLAVAGAPPGVSISIAYAAERLGLKHNTVVELVDRCEKEELLQRTSDPEDRRRVCLKVSSRGQEILDCLSRAHLRELDSQAPHLIQALQNVLQNETKRHGKQQPKKNG
jgi:DNA-binding MarR family transcriptional regulator